VIRLPKNVVPSESFIDQLLTLSNENRFDDEKLNQTEVMHSLLKRYERNRFTREYLKYHWTSLYEEMGPDKAFEMYKTILLIQYQSYCFKQKAKSMNFPKELWSDE